MRTVSMWCCVSNLADFVGEGGGESVGQDGAGQSDRHAHVLTIHLRRQTVEIALHAVQHHSQR